VIIASDVHVPSGRCVELPEDIMSASLLIANLEAPVLDGPTWGGKKAGPLLVNNPKSILQDFPSQTVFFTSNNHIGDFGLDGILSTMQALQKNHFGVWVKGNERHSHSDFHEQDVCLIATGEYGFLLPEGALQTDPTSGQIESEIDLAKKRGLRAIVLYHGGFEGTPIPSPALRARFRGWIDRGAIAVLSHHSHVLSYYEKYHGGIIDYGMGNFVVPPENWNGYHPYSLFSRTWTVVDGTLEPQLYQVESKGVSNPIRVSPVEMSECNRVLAWLDELEALSNSDLLESVIRTIGRMYWHKFYRRNLTISIIQNLLVGFPRLNKILIDLKPSFEKEFFMDLVSGESNRILAVSGSIWDPIRDRASIKVIKDLNLVPNSWFPALSRI
jgi:hypothetical protein